MKLMSIARGTAAGGVALLLAAAMPAIAVPTVTNLSGATGFVDYIDSAQIAPVGAGMVDQPFLYYIKEQEGTISLAGKEEKVQSWYIFFDPACKGVVEADISFTSVIKGVLTKTSELKATDSTFGLTTTVDYLSRRHTGTEKRDVTTWDVHDNTIHIRWNASDPGDHIRVYTVAHAPEPETYALMLAGLGVLGAVARRRAKREAA